MAIYKLTNGEEVALHTNFEVAKFVYLVAPVLKLTFDGWTPTVRHTPEVQKIIDIAEKFRYRRAMMALAGPEIPIDFDDDIPF